MRKIIIPFLFFTLLLCCTTIKTNKYNNGSYTYPDTNIIIIWNFDYNIFPEWWIEDTVNCKCTKIKESEVERSITVITRAFEKYPIKFLTTYISIIYLLDSLSCYDVQYGSTSVYNIIYFPNNGIINGCSDEFLEQGIHYQIANILLYKYDTFFDKEKWSQVNPENFKYGESESDSVTAQLEAIRENKDSDELTESLLKNGFLDEYSITAIDADFKKYAQNLFQEPHILLFLSDNYPRVKKKMEIVIDFYHTVNPIFDMNYFQKLSRE